MQLRKTTEKISRSFNEEGQQTETVENRRYDIFDAEGIAIGNIDMAPTYANISLHLSSFNDIDGAEAAIRKTLAEGITEE